MMVNKIRSEANAKKLELILHKQESFLQYAFMIHELTQLSNALGDTGKAFKDEIMLALNGIKSAEKVQ